MHNQIQCSWHLIEAKSGISLLQLFQGRISIKSYFADYIEKKFLPSLNAMNSKKKYFILCGDNKMMILRIHFSLDQSFTTGKIGFGWEF